MLRIFSILLLFTLLFSCRKNKKITPEKNKLNGLLKAVTIRSDAGETRVEYSYADSLTLKSIRHIDAGKSRVETFAYEKDTLRTSQAGDTLKKYIYGNGKLVRIEKHIEGRPGIYDALIFNYFSGTNPDYIRKMEGVSEGNPGRLETELVISWREENIGMFRERDSNGYVEDHDFNFAHQTRSPYQRLYSQTLRVIPEDPRMLSYNRPQEYSLFFAGRRYKVEGKYLATGLPLSETVFMENRLNGEWKPVEYHTYEYYNYE